MQEVTNFSCIQCKKVYPVSHSSFTCKCGGLLEVSHDWDSFAPLKELNTYKNHPSGVWRFKPLIHPQILENYMIFRGEGRTGLYKAPKKLQQYIGLTNVSVKHEGENPTGSFKDRGMTVALSVAKSLKKNKVICASTGNTSASLAAYASFSGLESYVVIPEGKIAFGKLAQAIAYGSNVFQSDGNFDDALMIVFELVKNKNLYLMNSVNPWRIEGQKTIVFELLEQFNWESPDYVIVPAGNLGNTSAFGKALKEAFELGLISKIPKIISVQSNKAQPFFNFWKTGEFAPVKNPETIATAINIGNPVSWTKAAEVLKFTKGSVISVSDQEIIDSKAIIDSVGIGCEPASAATVAGAKKLVIDQIIKPDESIVCILTGHILKDPKIVIDYHSNRLEPLKSTFKNQIKRFDYNKFE